MINCSPASGAGLEKPDFRRLTRQRLEDLFVFRETAEGFLREDQLAVALDLEDSARGFDEARFDVELLLDLGRQTGGPGEIVSDAAVFDLDSHAVWSPSAPIL